MLIVTISYLIRLPCSTYTQESWVWIFGYVFFFFQLSSSSHIALCCKEKSFVVSWFCLDFFLHCICNFSWDNGLWSDRCHLFEKKNKCKEKGTYKEQFSLLTLTAAHFFCPVDTRLIGGFVLVFCLDWFFGLLFFPSGIGNLQEKVSLDVLNQKAVQRKFCRIVYIQAHVHEQIAL